MKIIKKLWIRIVISLLAGGMLSESIHIRTGKSFPILLWIGAIIAFSFLSLIVWFDTYKYYFFPSWNPKENPDENILDEDL